MVWLVGGKCPFCTSLPMAMYESEKVLYLVKNGDDYFVTHDVSYLLKESAKWSLDTGSTA